MMNGHVEFAVGMCFNKNDEILITFGFQDNAAYILQTTLKDLVNFVNTNCAFHI